MRPINPAENSPFHPGEQALQARVMGEPFQERMQQMGHQILRPEMPVQHREFFARLPMVFIGGTDAQGLPWASLRIGEPGFVKTPDEYTLQINAPALEFDPMTLPRVGQPLGFLGLELETRRRNRVSGTVTVATSDCLELRVRQSFGNCPKYIQSRFLHKPQPISGSPLAYDFQELNDAAGQFITAADSFWISTLYAPADSDGPAHQGADVSYRGGKPGFVKLLSNQSLCFPDFSGNRFFNTLGNLQLNPFAGLLFIDFESGDLLYLTGKAHVIWSGPELEGFAGAERLITFILTQGRFVSGTLPYRWQFGDYSPALQLTGEW